MQRQLGLAVFSIAALYLSACSEGEPDARRFRPPSTDVTASAGSAGSSGAAGSGGASSGGAGGSTSGGGQGGGSAGSGPVTFPPPGCTGCVELDVLIDPAFRDANDNQYLFSLYNFVFPATGIDLSNATVTWSVSTLTPGDQVYVTPFAQSGADLNYAGVFRPQTLLTAENGFNDSGTPFVDVVLDLANTAPLGVSASGGADAGADAGGDAGGAAALLDNGGMDKSRIFQMGLQVGALATLTEPTTIRVLVDKVTFTGVEPTNQMLRDRDFSDGAQELVQNGYQVPAGSSGPTPY